jgi:hypothetical protein
LLSLSLVLGFLVSVRGTSLRGGFSFIGHTLLRFVKQRICKTPAAVPKFAGLLLIGGSEGPAARCACAVAPG